MAWFRYDANKLYVTKPPAVVGRGDDPTVKVGATARRFGLAAFAEEVIMIPTLEAVLVPEILPFAPILACGSKYNPTVVKAGGPAMVVGQFFNTIVKGVGVTRVLAARKAEVATVGNLTVEADWATSTTQVDVITFPVKVTVPSAAKAPIPETEVNRAKIVGRIYFFI
jgi:hypothetical protein